MKKGILSILISIGLSCGMFFVPQNVGAKDVDLYQWQMQEYRKVSESAFIQGKEEQNGQERSIRRFRRMKNHLRTEFNALQEEVETWRSTNDVKRGKIKKEMDEQNKAIIRLEKDVSKLKASNKVLEGEQKKQKDRYSDLEAQLAMQDKESTDLQKALNVNEEKFHQKLMKLYEKQKAKLEKKIETQKKYKEDAQKDIQNLSPKS